MVSDAGSLPSRVMSWRYESYWNKKEGFGFRGCVCVSHTTLSEMDGGERLSGRIWSYPPLMIWGVEGISLSQENLICHHSSLIRASPGLWNVLLHLASGDGGERNWSHLSERRWIRALRRWGAFRSTPAFLQLPPGSRQTPIHSHLKQH